MRQVMGCLGDQARTLMRAGVAHDRICVDPGPGFDKFADEDVVIQRATRSMVSMGYPVLTAVSRKRFVGAVSGVADARRARCGHVRHLRLCQWQTVPASCASMTLRARHRP